MATLIFQLFGSKTASYISNLFSLGIPQRTSNEKESCLVKLQLCVTRVFNTKLDVTPPS